MSKTRPRITEIAPDQQARGQKNSLAAAKAARERRRNQPNPADVFPWDDVIDRFKRDMRRRYRNRNK